jgi:hypothetical protein
MRINRDNYEQYFLDHAEGTLSPEMERELAIFLESNPDLKTVLESFDATPLPPQEIRNKALKSRLKKNIQPTAHINEGNVDEWLIKEIEGLLSEKDKAELNEFLAHNPAFVYDRKIFALTRLEPEQAVTFPQKAELKKKVPVITLSRLAWLASATAAMLLLVVGIRYFNRQPVNNNQQVIQSDIQTVAQTPPESTRQPETKTAEMKSTDPVTSQGTPSQGTPSPTLIRNTAFRIDQNIKASSIQVDQIETVALNLEVYEPARVVLEPEKSEKPLLAKAFGKMVLKARNAVGSNAELDNIRDANVDFWTIAEAGVKGFSTITDRDLELMVRRDGDGNLKSYALVAEDRLILTKSRD